MLSQRVGAIGQGRLLASLSREPARVAVPVAARENKMKGIEGVQAEIEENRAVLRGKKKAGGASAIPSALDPNAVPDSWKAPLEIDDKYNVNKSRI